MLKSKFKQTEIGMIPEDWEAHLWEDLATLEYGKGGMKYSETGKYPVFGTNGRIGFCNEYLFDGEGVIIGRKGAYRGVHFSKEPFFVIDTAFFLKPKQKLVMRWAYYQLLTQNINTLDSGSAIPSTSREDFYGLSVALPQLTDQSAIAKILSDLDSKIEINHKQKVNLEAIGLALFNKWFNVDEIPESWQTKPLDVIAEYLNGLPLQKYPAGEDEEYLPVIKIRELRNGLSDQTEKASLDIPEDYIVDDGDVLFSWSGTLEVEIWTNGKGALNQHLFKVSSKEYPKWFYYYWTKHFLQKFRHIAKGKATTMGHIQRHNLTESEVIIPDKKAFEDMNKIMSPIVERMIMISRESQNLEKIRDQLLPKLISGKIRVPVEVRA